MNVEKIKRIVENSKRNSEFYSGIGIKEGTFRDILSERTKTTVENLEKIAAYFKKPVGYFFDENEIGSDNVGIPLIPLDAVARYTEDNPGITLEDCQLYRVPEFQKNGAEFLIRVSGSSMYPKYSNGDVLACKKIHKIEFFQWGKVYVIDSSQGQMVKRIFEDAEGKDNITLVSDNGEKYPHFSIKKSSIRSLSIVLGVVRME
jgi:hypothetical protein